ncbi:MAG: N-acetylmuramoyl-L-alanine amidase [Candidatus Accumulibacter sp.]|nr:N-acetylmuramoyl-L-alanine amidase [Accumulibacter sp.]
MRPINLIVIHCSASPNSDTLFRGKSGDASFKTPVTTIDEWHAKRGFLRSPEARVRYNPGLRSIGYHYLVYRNGVIATGRDVPEIGAHVQGYNQKSIGICLIGTDRFTPAQWQSLAELIGALRQRYPDSRVVGHRDLSPDLNANGIVEQFEWLKTCPNFDVAAWVARGMSPIPESTEEVQ